MFVLKVRLRQLLGHMQSGAWAGGLLGGLDAIAATAETTPLGMTTFVVESSAQCALFGAIVGSGIGLCSFYCTALRNSRMRQRLLAFRILSRARTLSFIISGLGALAIFALIENASERIAFERLRWLILLFGAALGITLAMSLAHLLEPTLRRWFPKPQRSASSCSRARVFRFSMWAVIPTLAISIPLLVSYGIYLGVLRRILLLAVFVVLVHWMVLVLRMRPAHALGRTLGPLSLLLLVLAEPLLVRQGAEQSQNLTRATLLPDVLNILRTLNASQTFLDHPARAASRQQAILPRYSHHVKPFDGPFNVVWYIVDSLRADHLRVYGYLDETSPTLSSLAKESFVFEQAYSQSSTTSLSIPSMLSGRNPLNMRWKREGYPKASQDEFYVTQAFARAGYVTGLAINQWVKSNVPGIQYGFEQIKTSPPNVNWKSGDYLLLNLVQIIDAAHQQQRRFFVVAHVDDVHHPYLSAEGKSAPEFHSVGELARYDRGIAQFDQGLRILVEKLKLADVWDRTVLIVTADHGEEFGDHGGTIHSRTCYEEVTHVPLLVRIPMAGEMRIKPRVALLDLVPTLLEMLGAENATAQLDGQSLFIPAYEPNLVDPQRPIFCSIYQVMSGRPQFFTRSVRRGQWSFFEEAYTGRVELYDLPVDQRERVNVADAGQSARLVSDLRQLFFQVRQGNLYNVSEGLE